MIAEVSILFSLSFVCCLITFRASGRTCGSALSILQQKPFAKLQDMRLQLDPETNYEPNQFLKWPWSMGTKHCSIWDLSDWLRLKTLFLVESQKIGTKNDVFFWVEKHLSETVEKIPWRSDTFDPAVRYSVPGTYNFSWRMWELHETSLIELGSLTINKAERFLQLTI